MLRQATPVELAQLGYAAQEDARQMAAVENFELSGVETEVDSAPVDYEEDTEVDAAPEEDTAEACDDDDDKDWVSLSEDDLEALDVPWVETMVKSMDAAKEAEDAAAEEASVDITEIQVVCLDEEVTDEVVNEEAEHNTEASPGKYWTDLQHLIDQYTPGYPRNKEEIGPGPSKPEESDECEDWYSPVKTSPAYRKSRDPKNTPPKVI